MKHCTIIFLSFLIASSLAANCYGPASRLTVVEFAAFPSPVAAGEEIHIRANLQPDHVITAAQVQISVYYVRDNQEDTLVVSLPSLDLCTLSSKVSCPLQPTQNILAWDFLVPDILPGNYLVKYTILESNPPAEVNPYSCIQFNIVVSGVQANTFNSWYQATLLGTAIFTNPNYTQRQLGHEVQVGLGGNLDFNAPPYGMIKGLSGSGDLVPNPFYDTSSFVWGLSGTLEKVAYGPNGLIIHTYTGACYLGYINGAFNYDHENPLIEGTFHLNWTYKDSSTAQINGYANFEPATGTIPVGWGYPLLYGRLGRHEIVTSDVGFFMIKGSTPFCAVPGDCKSTNPDIGRPDDDNGLSSDMLGVAIGVPIAAVFIALLIVAALLFFKRKRETEQEDGVFAVARKPEYGSALVVDDIIEETRGSKTLQAMIDIKDEYSDDGSDDDSASQTSRSSRSRSRTPLSGSVSRSVSRSHSRHVRSGDESDPGESASRGSDSD